MFSKQSLKLIEKARLFAGNGGILPACRKAGGASARLALSPVLLARARAAACSCLPSALSRALVSAACRPASGLCPGAATRGAPA